MQKKKKKNSYYKHPKKVSELGLVAFGMEKKVDGIFGIDQPCTDVNVQIIIHIPPPPLFSYHPACVPAPLPLALVPAVPALGPALAPAAAPPVKTSV